LEREKAAKERRAPLLQKTINNDSFRLSTASKESHFAGTLPTLEATKAKILKLKKEITGSKSGTANVSLYESRAEDSELSMDENSIPV